MERLKELGFINRCDTFDSWLLTIKNGSLDINYNIIVSKHIKDKDYSLYFIDNETSEEVCILKICTYEQVKNIVTCIIQNLKASDFHMSMTNFGMTSCLICGEPVSEHKIHY